MTDRQGAGPDFIGIGAQRAGTSWLERSLRNHPDIWTAPVKEIHYFNTIRKGSPHHKTGAAHRWRAHLRYRFLRTGADILELCYDPRDFLWDCRYFLSPKRGNDTWYAGLFPARNGCLRGEITPAYAVLPEESVAAVARLKPDMKIIFIMRDPVARLWSSAALYCSSYGKTLSSLLPQEIYDIVTIPGKCARSDYPPTIRTWEKFFPQSQIFYAFFDEIRDDPHGLLTRLCGFLGVADDPQTVAGILSRPVNSVADSKVPMPDDIRRMVSADYRDGIAWLAERFPESPYPRRWLDAAEAACAGQEAAA